VDIQGGFLTASGPYVSSSNAVLNCALRARYPRQLRPASVSGSITLNGNLSVNLTNSYVPLVNDSFTILMAGARNSTFENFLYPSSEVSMQMSNTATSVILRVVSVRVHKPLIAAAATFRFQHQPDLDGGVEHDLSTEFSPD